MSKYGTAGTVTGQAFRVKTVQTTATAIPLPIVAEADLKKKDHPINIKHLSGKQKGAMVAVEKTDQSLYIAIARGSEPTDKWDATTMESDPVTPAA
ncbi:putative acetyl-CoA acetyltransferase [Escherichia phage vB_EcoP_B]|uniref:Putative acetyl-CoA acetyltransferase n=1 Tax=Escherichia phage vB_EcoP_B TaxID=1933107 RepID=A0A1Q1PU77_9CAUD|nr:acetyl-CoA acetyltransferase [Escherichia phage vB_EcoP_B]AQN31626.1 putative acetyl-CoA acetyltransferase [Escherichia phage vB_EcoP_B]